MQKKLSVISIKSDLFYHPFLAAKTHGPVVREKWRKREKRDWESKREREREETKCFTSPPHD